MFVITAQHETSAISFCVWPLMCGATWWHGTARKPLISDLTMQGAIDYRELR